MASMLNLRDALDEFGKSLGKRPISDNTRKAFYGDVSIFTRFVVPEERATLPAPAISTITADHIRAFLAHEERRVNANSPKSLERRLTSLKVFFSWLRESGYLGFDPAEGIAYKPFQDPLPEYLSDAEQLRVIDAARHVAAGERLDTRPTRRHHVGARHWHEEGRMPQTHPGRCIFG